MAYGITRPNYTAPATTGGGTDYLNKLGFGDLITSGKQNIAQLLNGLPSPDVTRTANAYFGAQSGMPSSDFIRNRGYDLYRQKAEGNRQRGLGDLNALLGSVATPELSNQSQQFQNAQFGSQLGQQAIQFNRNMELQDFLAQLQAIGLGQNIVDSGKNQFPNLNF